MACGPWRLRRSSSDAAYGPRWRCEAGLVLRVLRGFSEHLLNLGVELCVRHRADHAHTLELVVLQTPDHERRRSLHSGHAAFGDVLIDLCLELVRFEAALELGDVDLDGAGVGGEIVGL